MISLIKSNIRAYNRSITDERMDKMKLAELVGLCHPSDRDYLIWNLRKDRLINPKEAEKICESTIWKKD